MTWGGIAQSGFFATINHDGSIASVDYESARGDVSGVIDNLIVTGIRGRGVSLSIPSSGDVYLYDGSVWTPVASDTLSSGNVGVHNLLSVTHPDTITAAPVDGSLIAGSGAPASWIHFPLGLPNQQLRVSDSAQLKWDYDPIDIITSGSIINLDENSHRMIVNKTPGSSTELNLPTTPYFGQEILVKDGKGDANMNNIRVFPPSGLTIDGFTEVRLRHKFQSYHFLYNGSDWNVV